MRTGKRLFCCRHFRLALSVVLPAICMPVVGDAQQLVDSELCDAIAQSGHRDVVFGLLDEIQEAPNAVATGRALLSPESFTTFSPVVYGQDPLYWASTALVNLHWGEHATASLFAEGAQRMLDDLSRYPCDDRLDIIALTRFVRLASIHELVPDPASLEGLFELSRNTGIINEAVTFGDLSTALVYAKLLLSDAE